MAFFPYLQDKTILVGKVEEQLIPTVAAFTNPIPLSSDVTVDPTTTWATDLPRTFIIQDRAAAGQTGMLTTFNSEKIDVIGVTGTSGAYEIVLSGYTGISYDYSEELGASILTPGVEQTLTDSDFDCRIRNISITPKIDPDSDAEKFQTGDHGEDQSIMGARSGEISFAEKIAVKLATGSGLEISITAAAGYITDIDVTPDSAGIGYKAGDLVAILGAGGDELGLARVETVEDITGEVLTMIATPVNAGFGYSTASNLATEPAYDNPVWVKFMRAMGHSVKQYPGTGVGFLPLAESDDVTMTIHVVHVQGGANPKGQAYIFAGCKGTGDIGAAGVGKPYMLNAKFTGKFVGQEDVSEDDILKLTSPETNLPEKMLSNRMKTTLVSDGSTNSLRVSNWKLDFGNTVSALDNQADPTGHDYYIVTARKPRFTIDPLQKSIADEDVFNNVNNEQLVDVEISSALSNANVTVECPNSQLLYPAQANREGQVAHNRTYRCLRNDLGLGAAQPLIPNEAAYEILVGQRE